EDEIFRLLEDGAFGVVVILGQPGSGRTTALRHLAAVLPPGPAVRLIDDHDPATPLPPADDRLIVYAAAKEGLWPHRAAFHLARWTADDLIEYLLHTHPARCAAVMARLRPADHALFAGEPELWRAVLEELADDDGVRDARSALHRHLESALP